MNAHVPVVPPFIAVVPARLASTRLPDKPLADSGGKPMLVRSVAAHLAAHPSCAIATAAHPIHDPADVFNPNVVKVVLDAKSVALYFSRAPIPWSRDAWQKDWPDVAALAARPSVPANV